MAASHISNAGQARAGKQVVAENTQDRLTDQLFTDGNFAVSGDPEAHAYRLGGPVHLFPALVFFGDAITNEFSI